MAALAILFASCNGKKTDEHGHDHTDGTHEHADGEAHPDHEADSTAQEEFTVGNDTVPAHEGHDHQHEDGATHEH